MAWQEEIFAEKNLWSVFRACQGITGSKSNTSIIFVTALALTGVQIGWWYVQQGSPSPALNILTLREWAQAGVSFAAGILGFLLAGFSIFATMTKNELFVALANIPHKKGNISRLKFIFFNFLVVFIHYLTFLAICLFIHLFLGQNAPLTKLIGAATQGHQLVVYRISSIGLVIVGTYFIAVLLMLKSFIWNLYQSVLLAIATEDMLHPREDG
jgi:hypothetical protein